MYNTSMITIRVSYRLPVLLLSLLLLASASAEESRHITRIAPPGSILFVGNSYTFFNNSIYGHLRKLLVAENPATRESIFLKSMTISGARLSDHRGGLTQILDSRDWDVIVLQGHSREAIETGMSQGFQSTVRDFSRIIRSQGAEPVLFMTWAYSDLPEMTSGLNNAYTRLGDEVGALVVPVGLAFERAGMEIPGVNLYAQDGRHPSLEGTYLATAVFYTALYGKSPVDLEYYAGIDKLLARKLRLVAWKTVLEYNGATK